MFDTAVTGPAVDMLARLAGDGAALEFAIGTGRIAVPLAQRGIKVAGMRLERRWGGWQGEPFTARSSSHVSVYVKT